MQYVTHKGELVRLGKEIARGGEGAVFEVVGQPGLLAKRYLQAISAQKHAKLNAMLGFTTPQLLSYSAWPQATLHDRPGAPIAGVLMRRIVDARAVHELDTPAHRKTNFPKSDWRFLVRVARNCAAAVGGLHDAGIVIGDVNQGGFLISQNAMVYLIDCDSFQFQSSTQTFYCQVAVPEYLPPEMHGVKNFDSFLRSPNHDNFGLAIVLFRLLMMGRHPFAGWRGAGDKPIPDAIREYRFAFGPRAAEFQMGTPPHSLLLADLSPEVSALFCRAFSTDSHRPDARPTGAEWVAALDELELKTQVCPADPGHYHYSGVAACPWCRIERSNGPTYFASATFHVIGASAASFNVVQVWTEIQGILHPRNAAVIAVPPTPRVHTAKPLPPGIEDRHQFTTVMIIMTLCSMLLAPLGYVSENFVYIAIVPIVGFAVMAIASYVTSPLFKERRKRRVILAQHAVELHTFESQFNSILSGVIKSFDTRVYDASAARQRYFDFQNQESRELDQLRLRARERQYDQHLESFFIRDATIDGIGRGRVATLESYGIETARDISVEAVSAIPGFGPTLTAYLLAWKLSVERKFVFDVNKGIPHSDLLRIRSKYIQLRFGAQKQLEAAKRELSDLSQTAKHLGMQFGNELAAKRFAVEQARADLKAVRQ